MGKEGNKQAIRAGMLMLAIVLLVFGFIMSVEPILILINMAKSPVDLYEVEEWSTLKKGMHVQMELNYLHGELYEEILLDTSEAMEGIYLLPNLQFGEDGSCSIECFMLVETEWLSPYDKLAEASKAWWTDRTGTVPFPEPTIAVNGYLEEMPGEAKGFLKRYLTDGSSVGEEEVSSFIIPYVLKPYESDEVYMKLGIALLIIVPGILLQAIYFILRAKERAVSKANDNSEG